MEIFNMKGDMKWVESVIINKDNNNSHYPALKKLIDIFYNKWKVKSNSNVINSYRSYLKSLLRREFGR